MTLHSVAVNYRSSDDLPELLASYQAQTSTDWTLTIVDNSCDPVEAARLAGMTVGEDRAKVLVAPGNLGYLKGLAHAVQHGVAPEPGDWLALTNMDLALRSADFVERVLAHDDPQLGALAPAIISSATGRDQNPHLRQRPGRIPRMWWRVMFADPHVARVLIWADNTVRSVIGKSVVEKSVVEKSVMEKSGPEVPEGSGAPGSIGAIETPEAPQAPEGSVAAGLSGMPPGPATSSEQPNQPDEIYAPHGSLLLLSPAYLSAGGAVDQPVWLFGEEFTVAEECRRLGLVVCYDPSLVAEHREHVSTGRWRSLQMVRAQADSVPYILDLLARGDDDPTGR